MLGLLLREDWTDSVICRVLLCVYVCLLGMEAKAVLSQSGLVHTTLAQVWFVASEFSTNGFHSGLQKSLKVPEVSFENPIPLKVLETDIRSLKMPAKSLKVVINGS